MPEIAATPFTPWLSLAGGVLIGLAAALYWWAQGRLAGISGVAGRLLALSRDGAAVVRLFFIAGLLAAPFVFRAVTGFLPEQTVSRNLPLMALAGLLVGFGTALAAGCTSGHGVCGLARLSLRSLAATLTFMAAAIVTVYLTRHAPGF